MGAVKNAVEREKLVMNERESSAFGKLPIGLRTRIARLLGQEELIPVDRRKGENSHWHEKRADKIFVVKTPDGRKHSATPAEAAAVVDCSEIYLVEYMNKPLTKFERVRSYVMDGNFGSTVITWMEGAKKS